MLDWLSAPASCSLTASYPNGATAAIGTKTATPSLTNEVGFTVSWQWVVPSDAVGYATAAWVCTYGGVAINGSSGFDILDPTPEPQWSVLTGAYQSYPGGEGWIFTEAIYGADCTVVISYLNGTSTTLHQIHGPDVQDWIWTVPVDAPIGDTPYHVDCTYLGTTKFADGVVIINGPP